MSQPISLFTTRENGNTAPSREGTAVAATVYSDVFSCSHTEGGYSLHIEWTGTPTGNLQLWYTNKPNPDPASDADWDQDTTFGTAGNVALGGAAGKFGVLNGLAKARYLRLKLASGVAPGTLFAWVTRNRTS